MTPAQIARRRKTIVKNQWKWDTAEAELQKICSHVNASKKYCSDTGNWDRNSDSYWIDYSCPDCGKKWSVDQ